MGQPRKSNPSFIWVIRVLAADRRKPIGCNTTATSPHSASASDRWPWTIITRLTRLHSGPSASHLEVLVENGQGDVDQQWGQDSPLRDSRLRLPQPGLSVEDPRLEERFDQCQDASIGDPLTHPRSGLWEISSKYAAMSPSSTSRNGGVRRSGEVPADPIRWAPPGSVGPGGEEPAAPPGALQAHPMHQPFHRATSHRTEPVGDAGVAA